MGKLRKNTDGFTAVELLLIVLIIIVLAFVGWYVYHTDHKPKATVLTTSTSSKQTTSGGTSTPSTSSSSSTKYITITQWGVRAPITNNSVSLEYTLSSNSTPQYASFSSTELDASDSTCKSDGNDGGVVERYASTDIVQNEDGSSSGQTPSQYFSANDISSTDYALVGNYYYWYIHPQGQCGSTQASQDAQNSTISAVEALILTLQAVPSS